MDARRRHFDRIWAGRDLTPPASPGSRVAVIASQLKPGRRLLDLGGGPGLSAKILGACFQQIMVVDLSARPLSAAVQAGALATQGDFASAGFPFASACFDTVLCLAALQYADDPRAVVAEMFRVLRSEGQLGIIVPNMRTLIRVAKLAVLGRFPQVSHDPGYDGGTRHYFCVADIMEIMEGAGFRIMWHGGHIPRPAVARWLPERPGLLRQLKAEFFCAEVIVIGEKRREKSQQAGK